MGLTPRAIVRRLSAHPLPVYPESVSGIRTLLLGLVAALAACDSQDGRSTCDVETSALRVVALAVENGSTFRAEVDFSSDADGLGVSLALCDDDVLTIDGDEALRVDRPDRIIYAHTSDVTTPRTIQIALSRKDDAPVEFILEMPPSFEVVAPQAGADVSRSSEFVLEWAPANPGDSMRIELAEEIGKGVCLETIQAEHDYKGLSGVDIEDDGNWLVPANAVDGRPRDKCEATYRFTRTHESAYPAAFAPGGRVAGRIERRVAFVSVP